MNRADADCARERLLRELSPQVLAAVVRRYRDFSAAEDAVQDALALPDAEIAHAPDGDELPEQEDTLLLLFMCCQPALTRASSIALTLRAVGGLTTAEIARAFMVPEATWPSGSAARSS